VATSVDAPHIQDRSPRVIGNIPSHSTGRWEATAAPGAWACGLVRDGGIRVSRCRSVRS
jgi:hypothetical protein